MTQFDIIIGKYCLRFENVPNKPDPDLIARALEAVAATIRVNGLDKAMRDMLSEGPNRMKALEMLDGQRLTVVVP